MKRTLNPLMAGLLLVLSLSCGCGVQDPILNWDENDADAIIIGAGIAGLSAALEIAQEGADVVVVDMASVFGGHAVSSHGGLSIVGSPIQAAAGIKDTPEIAINDFQNWGENSDEHWVRYYAENSKELIYDWLVDQGVTFSSELGQNSGNSFPRFHRVRSRGLGLVTPIYLSCLKAGVRFQWNTVIEEIILEQGRVVGIRGRDQRADEVIELRAVAVMLATGGFQSDIGRVQQHWDTSLPFPERILAGSGWNSQGSGLDLAQNINARFHRLDHQWNYVRGFPDPRFPGQNRGLKLSIGPAVWVNTEGVRFVNPCLSPKFTLPAVLNQPTGSYWAIFDSKGKETAAVSGSGWSEEKVHSLILGTPELFKKASSIPQLALAAGIPEEALSKTISRFNKLAREGVDTDFSRFVSDQAASSRCQKAVSLETPPFYAVRLFPMARKSMGGVKIDRAGRVESAAGGIIPGFYAAGEVTGFAGINGRAGLEGTFLGPSIVTGRVGARTIIGELRVMGLIDPQTSPAILSDHQWDGSSPQGFKGKADNASCTGCHDLQSLVGLGRTGFWHFELSHRIIQKRGLECSQCHTELFPYDGDKHRVDLFKRAENCIHCHGLEGMD
jgi:predicted oxidoreductase